MQKPSVAQKSHALSPDFRGKQHTGMADRHDEMIGEFRQPGFAYHYHPIIRAVEFGEEPAESYTTGPGDLSYTHAIGYAQHRKILPEPAAAAHYPAPHFVTHELQAGIASPQRCAKQHDRAHAGKCFVGKLGQRAHDYDAAHAVADQINRCIA